MVMAVKSQQVGSRIESEGYYGTVRYVGEVPPTKGIWLGIDWDDPSRGKHNGAHQGKHYFNTRHETSGSFLRPQKANLGVDFLTALSERYGRVEAEGSGVILEEMYIKGHNQQTAVEVVGADKINKKQSDFEALLDVCLRGQCVRGVESDRILATECPMIRELDVSENLIPSWGELSRITGQLPHLYQLNVSDNVLEVPPDCQNLAQHFAKLKTLFANRMGWSWETVVECSRMWPLLEVLHLCFNHILITSPPPPNLANLRLLNLHGNHSLCWQHVLNLGTLANLESLILSKTSVCDIRFPDCPPDGTSGLFPSLNSLVLFHTKIQQWSSINELNKLACLENLKLRDVPLLEREKELSPETVRSLIIAKLHRLSCVNSSEVAFEERKGAELDYLKTFGLAWKQSGGHQIPGQNRPSAEFTNNHPRYMTLVHKYGAPEDSECVIKSSALKNNLISLHISCPQREDKKTVTKKLPGSMTVQKLKGLVQRLYRADAASLRMVYTSNKAVGLEYEFDSDLREISYYAIEDGDTIIVSWE